MRLVIVETGKSPRELSLAELPVPLPGVTARILDLDGAPCLENVGTSVLQAASGLRLEPGERQKLGPGADFVLDSVHVRVVAEAGKAADQARASTDETSRSDTVGTIPPTPDWGGGLVNAFEASLLFPRPTFRAVALRDRDEFVVGRGGSEADVQCTVADESVSKLHARIVFDGQSFNVEDLGSTNGTFVMGERLIKGERRRLSPESFVRFGSVVALFVATADAGCNRIPDRTYEIALRVLVSDRSIGRRDLAAARADGGDSVRDALLRSGTVTVETWSRAFRRAVEMDDLAARPPWLGSDYRWRRTVLVLLGVVTVLLLLLAILLVQLLR